MISPRSVVRRPRACRVLVAAALFLSVGVAHADGATAAQQRTRANEHMDKREFADALALYDAAHKATGDVALLYNLSSAEQALGQFPDALAHLERFSREAPPELKAKIAGLDDLLRDLRGRVATVTLSVSVPDARVLLRQKVVGVTPLAGPLRVNAGPALLEITKEGYEPLSRTLELGGGKELTLELALVPKASRGLLKITTQPPGAAVWIDGRAVGDSPAESSVEPGEHKLVLRRRGYEERSLVVVVAQGETKEVGATLTEARGDAKPLTSRWWFWAGAAVIVVGGVVTYVALTTDKSVQEGSLGKAQAPLLRF